MSVVYLASLVFLVALSVVVGWVAHLLVRPNHDGDHVKTR